MSEEASPIGGNRITRDIAPAEAMRGVAIEIYLDSFDPPLDQDERAHMGSAMMFRMLSQPSAGARLGFHFLTMSRKPVPSGPPHPFSEDLWPGWDGIMADGDVGEIEALARNPHPGARRLAALHPQLWDDLKDELATDLWREVRMAVARNPTASNELLRRLAADCVEAVAYVAQRRLDENGLSEDFLDSLNVCVECVAPIKNSHFQTCSISCSLDQAHRRGCSRLWADAIEVDFRLANDLRRDWPEEFIWRIAGSGTPRRGIPGMGPIYRATLVSFVRELTAGEILDLCEEVRNAGKSQPEAIALLEKLGAEMPGALALSLTRGRMGLGCADSKGQPS